MSVSKGEHIQVGQLEIVFLGTGKDTGGHADVYELGCRRA